LAFTSLAHFANDGASFFVLVIIDLLALANGVGPLLVTASLTLFWGVMAVSAIVLGPLIDRRGLQVSGMAFGVMSLSAGLLLFSVALDNVLVPYVLVVASAIAGLGASFYHPTAASLLQARYRGATMGRYLGVNGSAGSLGRALYPSLLLLVGAALASNTLSVQLFGTVGVAIAVIIFFGLRRAWGGPPKGAPDKAAEGPGVGSRGGSALTAGIVLLTVIAFIRSATLYGIVSWIPEYMSYVRGAGGGVSLGAMTTLMYAGPVVGQLFFGRLVEDHDRRMILASSTIISAALLFLYLVSSGTVSLVLLALFGFTSFSGFPILMSMTSGYIPKGSTTTSNALVWNLGNTGGRAAGPLIIGLLSLGSFANLTFAFEVTLIGGVVSGLMAFKLPKPSETFAPPTLA
jgi:MFS transporter, FSR family, fosmidomycin resistance protein